MSFATVVWEVAVVGEILAGGALMVVAGCFIFLGLAGLACVLDWLLLPDHH